jgi:hypothetical protein
MSLTRLIFLFCLYPQPTLAVMPIALFNGIVYNKLDKKQTFGSGQCLRLVCISYVTVYLQ